MATNAVKVGEKVNVPAKQSNQLTMKDWIDKSMKQIAKALPNTITADRFARIATTAVTLNPKLGQCTPASFIGAMLTAASLGLEVNSPLGHAYLIPYNRNVKDNNGQWHQIKEAQFQLGYRGMIELAHRSGEFKDISAHIVYENDEFDYELGLEPKLRHKPAMKNRGKAVWVYAVYHLVSGGYGFEVMSVEDIEEHRKKYSKAESSPWTSGSWGAMAKKTVLKRALKYAPLSVEFTRNVNNEEVTLNFDDKFEDKGIDAVIADEATRYQEDAVEVEVEIVEEEQA